MKKTQKQTTTQIFSFDEETFVIRFVKLHNPYFLLNKKYKTKLKRRKVNKKQKQKHFSRVQREESNRVFVRCS